MLLARFHKPVIAAAGAVVFAVGVGAGWTGWRSARRTLEADLLDDASRCAAAFDPVRLGELAAAPSDLQLPFYRTVKGRLVRLRTAGANVRYVHLCRLAPDSGKIVFLADSTLPGTNDEARPGADYPASPQSPALREALRSGQPVLDGPRTDELGALAVAFALVGETAGTDAGRGPRHLVALGIDAASWLRAQWTAALVRTFVGWFLLGVPLAALLVIRRYHEQREAIRNLSAALEQSHSALMIVDLEGLIEYANNGLCRQTGSTRRELIGRTWSELHAPEAGGTAFSDIVATVRSGQSWEGEWHSRRKDGTVYPVRGGITPVKDRDGSLACFIAIFDDVTDAKRKEAELRDARDLAQAGDRAKGQFLATMSHEIRTPLNGIVGFTNLLLGTSLTAEQREFVETIHASGEALIQLTSDILDYARIESGRVKLETQPCDPRECVEDALDLFAAPAAAKKLELLHTVADDVPAAIIVDGGRLRQVLTNLVNNAVKFTPAGEIEVSVAVAAEGPETSDGGQATDQTPSPVSRPLSPVPPDSCLLKFSVRDTGIGIPADQHAKLFRPFHQLDASSTRKFGGAGIGLAVCRNLVQLLGGKIDFTSAPGRGSTFTFTIRAPVAAPAPNLPDLSRLQLALVAAPGPLRRELAGLAARWGAQPIEADDIAGLKDAAWEIALVDLDEARARALTAAGAPPTGLPPRRTTALVPLTLSTELRAALRVHFHLLINKPVHHSALLAWLTGVRPAAPLSAPPPTHFGLHVLIVEDNEMNQRLMQKVLSNLGCKWTVAENGQRALDELKNPDAAYDVVLLDLHMPELDGLEMLKRVRAGECGLRAQTVWIAALTADVRREQRARVLAAGANDFLTKPLQLPELEAAFRRHRAERGASK